jgi:hypothetical protein
LLFENVYLGLHIFCLEFFGGPTCGGAGAAFGQNALEGFFSSSWKH